MSLMGQDSSLFQKRLAEIMAMPDGPEKDEEFRQLSMDYPGMIEDLESSRSFAEGMIEKDSPRGGVAGPASNPFSYYVAANPLEHAAAGAEKYMGHKQRKEAMDEIKNTRDMQQGQVEKFLRAGDPGVQSAQASMLRMTPEELEEQRRKEELRRKMLMYGGFGGGQVSS